MEGNWNGSFEQIGNGGFAGTVWNRPASTLPLTNGSRFDFHFVEYPTIDEGLRVQHHV